MSMIPTQHATHYRLKQVPEDFIVLERQKGGYADTGRFAVLSLKKKGYTTHKAISAVARALGIDSHSIGFAGNKDKHAVTEQAISVPRVESERVTTARIPDISLTHLGFTDDPLRLGDLDGNTFSITVREIEHTPKPITGFINYYGPQRFGRHNAAIGRSLVRRKYVEAITLICESSPDYAESLHIYIGDHPTNPIGALRLLPKTILMLYVHSYQALLWNETVHSYVASGGSGDVAPLIGFDTQCADQLMSTIVDNILTREGLTPRDFIFRDIPELCAEGGNRKIFVEVRDLFIGNLEKNDLGSGKKVIVTFSLPPGSYATVLIDQLFGNPV